MRERTSLSALSAQTAECVYSYFSLSQAQMAECISAIVFYVATLFALVSKAAAARTGPGRVGCRIGPRRDGPRGTRGGGRAAREKEGPAAAVDRRCCLISEYTNGGPGDQLPQQPMAEDYLHLGGRWRPPARKQGHPVRAGPTRTSRMQTVGPTLKPPEASLGAIQT